MTKSNLYKLTLTACLLAYIWLFYFSNNYNSPKGFPVCLVKNVTDIPCPSCGTSRAVLHFFNLELFKSILVNPFGVIVSFIMIIAPIWIIADFLFKKESFYQFYYKVEKTIQKKPVAIILIILVIANWIWNIKKNI